MFEEILNLNLYIMFMQRSSWVIIAYTWLCRCWCLQLFLIWHWHRDSLILLLLLTCLSICYLNTNTNTYKRTRTLCAVQCAIKEANRKRQSGILWYPIYWCWQFSLGPLLLSYLGAIAININWLSPFPRFFNIITFTTYPRPQWKLLPPRPWCRQSNKN